MRSIVFGLLMVLAMVFAIRAHAIVANAFTLMDSSAVTTTTTGTATIISPTGQSNAVKVKGRLVATNNSGTSPTLDVVIQHSPDCDGADHLWKDLITFSQVTTGSNNVEDVTPDEATLLPFACMRAKATLGGSSPDYDVEVVLYTD